MIHSLANHAFVMMYARRKFRGSMNNSNQKNESGADGDGYSPDGYEVAAIRAYSVWKSMMDLMTHEDELKSGGDVNMGFIWRASAGILKLSSHGMLLRRNETAMTTVEDEPMIGK